MSCYSRIFVLQKNMSSCGHHHHTPIVFLVSKYFWILFFRSHLLQFPNIHCLKGQTNIWHVTTCNSFSHLSGGSLGHLVRYTKKGSILQYGRTFSLHTEWQTHNILFSFIRSIVFGIFSKSGTVCLHCYNRDEFTTEVPVKWFSIVLCLEVFLESKNNF